MYNEQHIVKCARITAGYRKAVALTLSIVVTVLAFSQRLPSHRLARSPDLYAAEEKRDATWHEDETC